MFSPSEGLIICCLLITRTLSLPPIIVKNVTALGPQLHPDVANVSRDGGYSALINGNIVWLYDDTECNDLQGKQLSFVSNTAAYQTPALNVTSVSDFGVVNLGANTDGSSKSAILAGTTVGKGGWIPFQPDELEFNQQMVGKERVAIWPGTSPTPIGTTRAFLLAPLVYVDYKPKDPTKHYQPRGMTLIAINAPASGPIAIRQGDLIIPGTEVPFGGFSTLVGHKSTNITDKDEGDMDVYLVGMTDTGLQLARVGTNDLGDFSKYTFWDPQGQAFSTEPPKPIVNDTKLVYVPGSFSSGSVFYSPYFKTFIMIYFNKMVDSTFYIRYLLLDEPLQDDNTWKLGGKNGQGIAAEDVEALVKYQWSSEEKLYASPPDKGGFNYAGNAHPEYFNRQYFPNYLYPSNTPPSQQFNDWYGSDVIAENQRSQDGKNLLLSWTSQTVGGMDNGVYQIELAVLEFDDIPQSPDGKPSSTTVAPPRSTDAASPTKVAGHGTPHVPVSSLFAAVGKGGSARVQASFPMYIWGLVSVTILFGLFGNRYRGLC